MVEAHFVKRRCRSISGNVAADVVLDAVRTYHHGQGVPADETLDAALQFLVTGEKWFEPWRDGVGIRRVRSEWEIDAVDSGVRPKAVEDFRGELRAARFLNEIHRPK